MKHHVYFEYLSLHALCIHHGMGRDVQVELCKSPALANAAAPTPMKANVNRGAVPVRSLTDPTEAGL